MTTNQNPATASATFLLDGDTYVARGGTAMFDGTPAAWADRFYALGGVETSIRPAWITGAPDVTFQVLGSPDAIAFVESTAPLATR